MNITNNTHINRLKNRLNIICNVNETNERNLYKLFK